MNAVTQQPSSARHRVLAVTAVMAVFMYIDRVCIAQVSGDIQSDLGITPAEMDWVKRAFFWSYAISQVPAGLLGIRFSIRRMLALYLFLWSFFTVISGLAGGFAALLGARLAVGVTEAGAYPNAAALVKAWFPISDRGFANSIVSLGGRFGGALGQLLTPALVTLFAGFVVWNEHGVPGWRLVLVLFGVLGMLWAFVFYGAVRDKPGVPDSTATGGSTSRLPVGVFLGSRTLWAFSLMQFFINLGWAFLITQFPDYLQSVHHITGSEKGWMSSLPGFVGCLGMFAGGFLTDRLVRKLGVQRGRVIPIVLGAVACTCAYLCCADRRLGLGGCRGAVRHDSRHRPCHPRDLGRRPGHRRPASRPGARLGQHVGELRGRVLPAVTRSRSTRIRLVHRLLDCCRGLCSSGYSGVLDRCSETFGSDRIGIVTLGVRDFEGRKRGRSTHTFELPSPRSANEFTS